MTTVLINPYPYYAAGVEGSVYPPLGLLYLAACARDTGPVSVLDANALRWDVTTAVEWAAARNPDVIGVSVNMVTARSARELLVQLRTRCPNAQLVAGGPLPTANPSRWLPYADYVVCGEGERSFAQLVRRLAAGRGPDGIPGVCGQTGMVPSVPVDPDTLPFPAYDSLWPPLREYLRWSRARRALVAPLLSSRGCPYSCAFCDKTVHGSRFRSRSPESVLAEVDWLRGVHGVNQLDVLDDNFTHDRDRAAEILRALAGKNFSLNCHNGVRVDRLTRELVSDMRQAGVFKAGIGVESGSSRVLGLINKHIDLDQARQAVRWFREFGITVHGFFILGFPFETRTDIEDTIRAAREINPHYANFAFFLPVPGTDIYDQLLQSGRLLQDCADGVDAGFFQPNSLFRSEHFEPDELKDLYRLAWRRFYLRPAKALDIIRTMGSPAELRWVLRIGLSVIRHQIAGGEVHR